jgi:hypothetical protein
MEAAAVEASAMEASAVETATVETATVEAAAMATTAARGSVSRRHHRDGRGSDAGDHQCSQHGLNSWKASPLPKGPTLSRCRHFKLM